MNNNIEFVYLLSVFVFLLLVSVNLTKQLLDIYYTEKKIQFLKSIISNIHKNESLTYILSKLYVKKCQWIDAIRILQRNLQHKLLYDINNGYSLANLNSAIGYVYDQLNKDKAAKYYFKCAISFNYKNIIANDHLFKVNETKL